MSDLIVCVQRLFTRFSVSVLLGSMGLEPTRAETNVPEGFRLERLSNGINFNRGVSMNNRGEVVWYGGVSATARSTFEIYHYRNNQRVQITDDDVRDSFPDINDDGTMVWTRQDPGGWFDIVMYEDGDLVYLTDEASAPEPAINQSPRINAEGMVVWQRTTQDPCGGSRGEIWFFDGVESRSLAESPRSQQAPVINDFGDIVWFEIDLCATPWQFSIWQYDGDVHLVTNEHRWSQLPAIDNLGRINWTWRPGDGSSVITRRDGDDDELISQSGSWGRSSDDGEKLVFSYWLEDEQSWQVGFYEDTFTQITSDDNWQFDPDVNNRGEIVWIGGPDLFYQVQALLRPSFGDLNCDLEVNVSDIDGFIIALVDPDSYAALYPQCDALLADLNLDQQVTVSDIGEFIRLITF